MIRIGNEIVLSPIVIPSFDKIFPVLEHQGNLSSIEVETRLQPHSVLFCHHISLVNPKDLQQLHISLQGLYTPVKWNSS